GAKPILFEPELGAPRLVALGQARPVPGARPGLGPLALQQAVAQIGTPYAWGGSRPGGFDCSGLVFYVYAKLGIRLPRVAADQAKVGAPVTLDQLAPGDAVFFADSSGYIHHMGLYVGDGKFVHAPRSGETVRIDDLTTGTYALQYAGARRYSP
ncbi:MAG TPA: C40 family peptidase, partial [Miltoncostaeaceae bacterium]|nr:C40 family peptidase [Miltoncostaeaceae bacterium]